MAIARTDVTPPQVPGLTGGSGSSSNRNVNGGILWNRRPYVIYRSKTWAKNAYRLGKLTKSEMKLVNDTWKKYGRAAGFKTARSFWTAVVDDSSETKNPFDVINSLYAEGSLDGGGSGPGSGAPSVYTNISIQQYNRSNADAIIDAALLSVFGRKATDAEKSRFFKEINKAAKAGTVTKVRQKGGKTITTTTSRFEEGQFVNKYVGTVLDSLVAGKSDIDFEGEAGKVQDTLRKYSQDMGLYLAPATVNSYVYDVVKGNKTADDAAADMRNQAIALYKNFADRLKADNSLTVRDLANPYIQLIADTFETDANNISLTDSTLQNIISSDKLPSYGDVYKQLRQDTRFRSTMTAKREASSFASAFASAMGF